MSEKLPQNGSEREKAFNPAAELNGIIKKPLTPGNIEHYFDDALEALTKLTNEAADAYEKIEGPKDNLKETEDRAFEYFGLQSIPEILTAIQNKRDLFDEVNVLLHQQKHLTHIITPPDAPGRKIVEGSAEWEWGRTAQRLKALLFILAEDGIPLDALSLSEGDIRETMMRTKSYVDVRIPPLNREVLVCDEIGNVSYVFDAKVLAEIGVPSDTLLKMTKEQLNELLARDIRAGARLVVAGRWIDNLREALHQDFGKSSEDDTLRDNDNGLPKVSTFELDPWRGFYQGEDGKHYGITGFIEKKLGMPGGAVLRFARKHHITPHKVRYVSNTSRPAYPYEDIEAVYSKFPGVEREGPWRGFYEFEGKHYGPSTIIAARLNSDRVTVIRRTKDMNIPAHKIRGFAGRIIDAYPFEDVARLLKGEAKFPKVNVVGPWKGFFEKDGMHFGSIKKIAKRKGISENLARGFVAKQAPSAIQVRDLSNHPRITAYNFEQFETMVEDFLALPKVDMEGEWIGFFEKDGAHFGTIGTIAHRLGVSRSVVELRIQKSKSPVSSVKLRDRIGHESVGYSLEEMQRLMQGK